MIFRNSETFSYTPAFLVLIMLLSRVHLAAQTDTVFVAPDIPPGEGNLNAAVKTAISSGSLSSTVFKLESNGYYILNENIVVPQGELLTITAPEPGNTQETSPPQIIINSNRDTTRMYLINSFGDLSLSNIWFLFADTLKEQNGACIMIQDNPEANASGKGENAVFNNVIFDYSSVPFEAGGAVTIKAKHFNGKFINCYFKNCIDPHYRYYGRAVSFPYNQTGFHIDSLLFENCTFASIGYVYSQQDNNYADNVRFNHCTFLNVVMFPFQSGWWWKMSVTNSVFVNSYMLGYIPDAWDFYGGPNGGTIRIDSISTFGFNVPFPEDDRYILFTNNSYLTEGWLIDFMESFRDSSSGQNLPPPDQTSYPQPMMNLITFSFFDSTVSGVKLFPFMNRAYLYDSTDPDFILPPTDTSKIKEFLYHKWFDSADLNWAYKPERSLNREWPFEENLSYTNPVLLSAGLNSFPLGDIYRWFPEQYEDWEIQKENEYNRIEQWLYTGQDPGIVSVTAETSVPKKYILGENYPNPFNPSTTIKYSIPEPGIVSLKVYNMLGEEVAVLFDGFQQTGNYIEKFDAKNLSSGVYLYRLKADNYIETKKLLLLK